MCKQRGIRAAGTYLELGGVMYRLGMACVQGDIVAYPASVPGSNLWKDILIRELSPRMGVPTPHTAEWDVLLHDWQVESKLLGTAGCSQYYEDYGTSYVVRTMPKAVTLHTYLEQSGEMMPLAQVFWLMDQLLTTVELIHEKGLLHLEVTPSRLYLLPQGQLFLDHICLWNRETLGKMSGLNITSGYTAPELQLRNFGEVRQESDLYSCCAVFLHMLLGKPMKQAQLVSNSWGKGLPQLLEERRHIPRRLCEATSTFLYHGLHTLPRRRFCSAREMHAALYQLAGEYRALIAVS